MVSALVGIIIDTSTLIIGERGKHSVREIFAHLRDVYGDTEVGLSVVTVMELAHGIERAKLDVHRRSNQAFPDDLTADIRIYPVTEGIARHAERISGQQTARGVSIAFEDLLIGGA